MYGIDPNTLAVANLALQSLLMAVLLVAAYFAKNRRFQTHCAILRVAVSVQILDIAAVMLPAMLGSLGERGTLFFVELLFHRVLGIVVVIIWVYVNLALAGIIQTRGRLTVPMRLAMASWVANFLVGLHLYATSYL